MEIEVVSSSFEDSEVTVTGGDEQISLLPSVTKEGLITVRRIRPHDKYPYITMHSNNVIIGVKTVLQSFTLLGTRYPDGYLHIGNCQVLLGNIRNNTNVEILSGEENGSVKSINDLTTVNGEKVRIIDFDTPLDTYGEMKLSITQVEDGKLPSLPLLVDLIVPEKTESMSVDSSIELKATVGTNLELPLLNRKGIFFAKVIEGEEFGTLSWDKDTDKVYLVPKGNGTVKVQLSQAESGKRISDNLVIDVVCEGM